MHFITDGYRTATTLQGNDPERVTTLLFPFTNALLLKNVKQIKLLTLKQLKIRGLNCFCFFQFFLYLFMYL